MDMLAADTEGATATRELGEHLDTSTDDRSGLQMSLPARAENVAVVRHAVAGLGERLGMDEPAVADLKTVVTEAAMNVVVHAYPEGADGLLEVDAFAEGRGLTVEVRDQGGGIRPRPDVDRPSLRIGLTLIAALSSNFEIKGGSGRGTVIRMHLPLSGGADDLLEPVPALVATAAEETEVRVGPPDLVGTVLARVIGALAARQEVSLDRLSDALLLSDAIAAAAPSGFADGHVSLSLADRDGAVVLSIGPMLEGGAERLRESLELPQIGSLADLAAGLRVERAGDGERLVIEIAALAA
jgi:serine/threonine-protein kinase RsbW